MLRDPEILVVGGNNGGLALALALQRVGMRAKVFERMDAHPPVEGGLHIAANGVRSLARMGMAAAIAEHSTTVERTQFRWKDGAVLVDVPTGEYARAAGTTTMFIRRRNLTGVMAAALHPGTVHFGKRAVGFEQDERGVTVRFADGSDARGDVLVAADGIRSTIRSQLLGDIGVRWAGYGDWGCVVDFAHPAFPPGEFMTWYGDGLRFGAAHIGHGEVYWAASIPGPPGAGERPTPEQLAQRFAGWASPVPELVATATPERLFGADIGDLAPLERWGKGRVVLLGDAAHATTPSTGRGASEALHDGVTLANALALVRDFDDHARVAGALRVWADSRRPQTRYVTRLSRHIGWIGKRRSAIVVKTYLRAGAFSVRQQFRRDVAIDVPELADRSPAWRGDPRIAQDQDPHVATVLRIHRDFFNGGDFEAVEDIFAPSFRYFHHATVKGPMGKAQARMTIENLRAAFPDLRIEPEVSARSGDTVLTQSVLSGTHLHDFNGIPPTGRHFSEHIVYAMRFEGDKLAETRLIFDALSIVQQLIGAGPPPTSFPPPVGRLMGWLGRRKPNRLPSS